MGLGRGGDASHLESRVSRWRVFKLDILKMWETRYHASFEYLLDSASDFIT